MSRPVKRSAKPMFTENVSLLMNTILRVRLEIPVEHATVGQELEEAAQGTLERPFRDTLGVGDAGVSSENLAVASVPLKPRNEAPTLFLFKPKGHRPPALKPPLRL